jgi:hypothetical protein
MSKGASVWRKIRRAVVVGVAALAAVFAAPASAQGTSGTLPDPVSGGDLNKYLDRYLDLTPAQWEHAEKAHETYKEEFKRLRETEIEGFLEEMRKIQGRMPKKDELRAFLEKMDRMQDRIRGLDSRLFSEIETALDDTQRVVMPRVRKARERETYRGDMIRAFSGGASFDLTETFYSLELSSEERQAAEPVMVSYENSLTPQLKKLYDATTNSFVVMFEAIEKSGVDTSWMDEAQQGNVEMDPEKMKEMQEKMQAFMEVMRAAMSDATKKSLEIASDITKLHHSTRAALAAHLKPETRRALRDEFFKKAYSRIANTDQGAGRTFQAAMKLHYLTPDERVAIQAAADAFQRSDDAVVEEMVEAIDDFRATRNPMDWGQDYQKHEEEIQKIAERRQAAATQAIEGLYSLLGPEGKERLARVGTPEDVISGIGELAGDAVASEVASAVGSGEPGAGAEITPAGDDWTSWGGDVHLPGMMGPKEIGVIARMLDVDGGRRALLDALHTEYVTEFGQLNETLVKSVQETQQAMWQRTQGENAAPVIQSEGDIEKLYALRKTARDAILALDAKFFQSVADAVATESQADEMKLLRLHRASGVYQLRNFWGMMMFDQTQEDQITPMQVLAQVSLDEGSQMIVNHMLLEKADELEKSMRELWEAMVDGQMRQEQYYAKAQAKQQEDPDSFNAMGLEYMELAKKLAEKSEPLVKRQLELNRGLLTDLEAALPTEHARDLRRSYNRLAFPQVFQDAKSAEPFLERATKLSDLDDTQRGSIQQALEEYRQVYNDHSDSMVAIAREQKSPMGGDQEAWQEHMKLEEKLAKHRFERDEASAKALRKLRTILRPEQANRLPGLATVEHDNEPQYSYP